MPNLRQLAIDFRRVVSTPRRQLQLRRLSAKGKAPISVLFYHRVADEQPNDWTIPCDLFQEQMEWIRERFDVIDMQEVQRRIRQQDSRRPAVHITFDDGYAENSRFALPYLIRNKMPCTYFVSYGNCVTGDPFPHDVAAGCPLPVNSLDELKALAGTSVDIGYHTRTHCDCGNLITADDFRDEITDGAAEMRAALDMPLRYFAFPYGLPDNIPIAGIQAAYAAGFQGFCSAYGAYNLPGQDAFHIRRIHGDAEMSRFKNWLSFDARKLHQRPEIRYWLPPANNWEQTLELVG
ncbi:polysaccharide deacetylase family protein [Rosistilla oblonga]|uniref:polysaccharide deacetylase family protein n=1 Tax=Rosistilla oblonga TaxID=2527990 RepID=UPI003A96F7DC